jgi:hypothetical protein
MDIYAKSGNHVLLFQGKIKLIGSLTNGKRFDLKGQVVCFKKVILNYGTEFTDIFYFENDVLIYSDISFEVDDYISETYQQLISNRNITVNHFLDGLLGVYVFKEMGF